MSSGKEVERLSTELSSSPQTRDLEQHPGLSPTALSPTLTLGHSSPELPPLPDLPALAGLNNTPAAQTTSASDTSYYTASWGSPYQNPPPRSIASNLAGVRGRSPSASSEVDEDSPNPRFGLSHLIPSRLSAVNRVASSRPSSPSLDSPTKSPTRFEYLSTSAQSIRQFFTSPTRGQGGALDRRRSSSSAWNIRSGWRKQDEGEGRKELELLSSPPLPGTGEGDFGEPEVEPFQLDGTADTLARTDRLRFKGHKSRDSNLTLTQDNFWPTFNIQEATQDSGNMYASRFADTANAPPLSIPKNTPKKDADGEDGESPMTVNKPGGEQGTGLQASPFVDQPSASPVVGRRATPPAQLFRNESIMSSKPKRTVKYRGKNVHINVPPRVEGSHVPLSKAEVKERLQKFEKNGYDTRGFGHWHEPDVSVLDQRSQNRQVFPDPAGDIAAGQNRLVQVHIPNRKIWDDYVAFLREEKLRLLGVSLGGGESTESPISRQPSANQFPQSLPFSPPLPTSSAGSMRHAHHGSVYNPGFVPQISRHSSTQSIASPMSMMGNRASLHTHRQSMFSPPTFQQQGPPPHGLQSFSPQTMHLMRGSPALDGSDRRSPLSPFGFQEGAQTFPFAQRNELLVQMQRQKDQQLAAQAQQQPAAVLRPMLPPTRPSLALQEVPEAEDEDETNRPQPRSRQGEPPELVNPKPSHRHNISVKLEQGLGDSDYHLEESIKRQMDEDEADAHRSDERKHTKDLSAPSSSPSKPMNGTASLQGSPEPTEASGPNLEKVKTEKSAPIPAEPSSTEADLSKNPWADDPTFEGDSTLAGESVPRHSSHHSSKSSVFGLNVDAKAFSPSANPSANFNPGIFSGSSFSFKPNNSKTFAPSLRSAASPPSQNQAMSRTTSFGSLNASAPSFNPTAQEFNPHSADGFGSSASFNPGKSHFSFISNVPSVQPVASVFTPDTSSSEHPGSIFGKLEIANDGKKIKKSKAVPIVYPGAQRQGTPLEEAASESLSEGEDGRLRPSSERQKRARRADADGDSVPLFALPTDQLDAIGGMSPLLESDDGLPTAEIEEKSSVPEPKTSSDELEANVSSDETELPKQAFLAPIPDPATKETHLGASPASPGSSEHSSPKYNNLGSSTMSAQEVPSGSTSRVFSNTSTLSALAMPFEFKPSFIADRDLSDRIADRLAAAKETSNPPSESERARTGSLSSDTVHDKSSDVREETIHQRERLPSSIRYFDDLDQASFQEIDEIMQHFNEQGSDGGIERDASSWPASSPRITADASPMPISPQLNFPAPSRSDAPSPSPPRPMVARILNVPDPDSASNTQDPFSDGRAVANYDSPIRPLNESNDHGVSEWDDMISSGQEDEFKQRAEFYGPRVSGVVKAAMDDHFGALETMFKQLIEDQLSSVQQPSRRARSRVTVDSDADDEDEDVETDAVSRGFSPKRDRRMEKYRTILQEVLGSTRPRTPQSNDASQFGDLKQAIAEVNSTIAQSQIPSMSILEQMRGMIEESAARQTQLLIKQRDDSAKADDERFHDFALQLREAATLLAAERDARSEAERKHAEAERLLALTEEELDLFKEAAHEDGRKLKLLEEAARETKSHHANNNRPHGDTSEELTALGMENEALKETLEEYRLSSDKWRRDIEDANAEKDRIHASFGVLKMQAEEALRVRETMHSRIERLQIDTTIAVGQVASERAKWVQADAENRTRYEILAARAEAEARTRERFERELERLELQERQSYQLKAQLEHEQRENVRLDKECQRLASQLKDSSAIKLQLVQAQKENAHLEEVVEQLKLESSEHEKTADRYAQEFREAREAGRLEVQRTRSLMEIDIDSANNETNIVRANLEAGISRLRTELENATLENDTLKTKHASDLEAASDDMRETLQDFHRSKETVLQELRHTFEERLEELRKQHRRDLDHTIENKNQSETFLRESHATALQDLQDHHERSLDQALNERDFMESQSNERLTLAHDKVEHLQDKVKHLEEKLEIAKSAAHAAALAAQSVKSPQVVHPAAFSAVPAPARLPEKISPQALRESIAVLQEQLQERETRIEDLEQELAEVDKEAPAKIKAKETEIGWLRELIGVRIDDLSDLVDVLSRPSYDREAAKNAAIRIKASIQMEQQDKDRQLTGPAAFPSLATISNFASPRAAQLAAAIGNWRKTGGGMVSSSLAQSTPSASSSRTQTPSKPPTSAQSFLNGLMTPPASNLRKTPSPQASVGSSRPRPLNPHHSVPRPLGTIASEKRPVGRDDESYDPPSTPPLLQGASYDEDADESVTGYYDDENSTVDGTPRADHLRPFQQFGTDIAER